MNHHIPLLNFTNYTEHPSNPNIIVYSFKTKEEAAHFEAGLIEKAIFYEKDDDGTERNPEMTLFAVKRKDDKVALQLNFLTSAKFRKPFMPDKLFRYTVIFITLFLIVLSIVGYGVMAQKF